VTDLVVRGAADDIDDEIRVSEGLEKPVDALPLHGPEKFVRHAVDVDGQ
jgi:hypothetical protein